MKVSELTGAKLDYWVAKAEGKLITLMGCFPVMVEYRTEHVTGWDEYSPSTDWSQGGPIIDREEIELVHRNGMDGRTLWAIKENIIMRGETKLIAAMRCYVASKFGEEVPDDPTK